MLTKNIITILQIEFKWKLLHTNTNKAQEPNTEYIRHFFLCQQRLVVKDL